MKESLQDQFVLVRQLTTMSHVMQYGDLTWTNTSIGQFEGEVKEQSTGLLGRTRMEPQEAPSAAGTLLLHRFPTHLRFAHFARVGIVDSRDVVLHSLYYKYIRADKTDLGTFAWVFRSEHG